MKSIAFSMTTPQILDRSKTVTRRLKWLTLRPGTLLLAVRQAQGLPRGAHQEALAVIRVTAVGRERLNIITQDEVDREGFAGRRPREFVEMFCYGAGIEPEDLVTRIEFEYLSDAELRDIGREDLCSAAAPAREEGDRQPAGEGARATSPELRTDADWGDDPSTGSGQVDPIMTAVDRDREVQS